MKRYTAYIDVIDNDYRSWVGTEHIQVDSWEEATEYCRKKDWSGHSHLMDSIRDNKTKKYFDNKKDYENGRRS